MNEKVKLPKEICDALHEMIRVYDAPEIINEYYNDRIQDPYVHAIRKVSASDIMHALVLGFEEARTPEEQIRELYEDDYPYHQDCNATYREGVRDALRIHGIHYDWLEDEA